MQLNQIMTEIEFCSAQLYKAESKEDLEKIKMHLLYLQKQLEKGEESCLQLLKQ